MCECAGAYMCVGMHTFLNIFIFECMNVIAYEDKHICIPSHACVYICVNADCMYVCMHACIYTCTYVYLFVRKYTCTCVYECICLLMYVCMHVCIYQFIHVFIQACTFHAHKYKHSQMEK